MKTGKLEIDEKSFAYTKRLLHELSTASDFGVPNRLVAGLHEKIRRHKNLRLYLGFLLNRLRSNKFKERLPVFIGPKTEYQGDGQHLEYFQFRPYVKEWTELMIIARARGGSATLLFVILLEMDMNEFAESEELVEFAVTEGIWAPVKPIRFLQTLNLRSGLWSRVLKFGRSSYHSFRDRRLRPVR